jgi:hypothetical protein
MFDVLVEPVLSYASHIWGPLSFKKFRAAPYSTKSEKVHTVHVCGRHVQGPASYPGHVSLGGTCGALVEQDVCS